MMTQLTSSRTMQKARCPTNTTTSSPAPIDHHPPTRSPHVLQINVDCPPPPSHHVISCRTMRWTRGPTSTTASNPTSGPPHILQVDVEGPRPHAGQDHAPAPHDRLAPRHTDVDAGVKRLHMLPMAPHCFHGLRREGGEGREGRAAFARFTGRTSCLQQIVLPSTCILSDRNSWYFQL